MRAAMGKLLEALARVLEHSQAHGITDPGAAPVIESLGPMGTHAREAMGQQAQSAKRSSAANAARSTARRRLWGGVLRFLAESMQLGVDQTPEFRGARAPRKYGRDIRFLGDGQALVRLARTHLDALSKLGVTAAVIDDAERGLVELEALRVEAKEAYRVRLGASQTLLEMETAIRAAIKRLDRYNRYRFVNDPVRLAEWEGLNALVGSSARAKPAAGRVTPPSGSGGETKAVGCWRRVGGRHGRGTRHRGYGAVRTRDGWVQEHGLTGGGRSDR